MGRMEEFAQFLIDLPFEAQIILAIVIVMYLLRMVDGLFMKNRMSEGVTIRPRSREHILGIVFAHWFHVHRKHLFGNTLPFLIMGSMIAITNIGAYWVVTGLISLFAGIGTWLFGAKGNHEGASGLISGYFGFIILNGFRTNEFGPILGALAISAVNFALFRTAFGYYEGLSRAFYFFGLIGGLLAVFIWERIVAGNVG